MFYIKVDCFSFDALSRFLVDCFGFRPCLGFEFLFPFQLSHLSFLRPAPLVTCRVFDLLGDVVRMMALA